MRHIANRLTRRAPPPDNVRPISGRVTSSLLIAAIAALVVAIGGPAASEAQAPACAGAQALDPAKTCTDTATGTKPTVDDPFGEPDHPCRPLKEAADAGACAFGASEKRARLRIALIGDSHSFAWRAALHDIAGKQRWRGYSFAFPACQFTETWKHLQPAAKPTCKKAYAATKKFLKAHREIDAVIMTHEGDTELVVPAGQDRETLKVAGFKKTWKAYPKNIRRVIVLRDTPNASAKELECVKRIADAKSGPPGPPCAIPKSFVVPPDAAVTAQQQMGSSKYRTLDMNDLICDDALCYPALGGVLVNRDQTGHVTQTFARSTEPYLLARLKPLLPKPRTVKAKKKS